MKTDIAHLGQVFTPIWVVDRMLSLRENAGTVLEPSAGDGAFLEKLEPSAVGLELCRKVAHERAAIRDFLIFLHQTNSTPSSAIPRMSDFRISSRKLNKNFQAGTQTGEPTFTCCSWPNLWIISIPEAS